MTHETLAPAELARAIEVFARGFSFARSFTHPYVPELLSPNGAGSPAGTLWVMRDADRRTGTYRKEEWVSHGLDPEHLHAAAASSPWRERTRACRSTQDRGGYSVCAMHATEHRRGRRHLVPEHVRDAGRESVRQAGPAACRRWSGTPASRHADC